MITLLAVAAGGALGAVARYCFGKLAGLLLVAEVESRLPLATFGVNVIGSFAIGIAFILVGDKVLAHELWRPFFIVGFLGAFTTFSAFSLDALLLLQQGHYNTAFAYVASSLLVCLLATFGGMQLARLIA